jgi:hypothetical protein
MVGESVMDYCEKPSNHLLSSGVCCSWWCAITEALKMITNVAIPGSCGARLRFCRPLRMLSNAYVVQ